MGGHLRCTPNKLRAVIVQEVILVESDHKVSIRDGAIAVNSEVEIESVELIEAVIRAVEYIKECIIIQLFENERATPQYMDIMTVCEEFVVRRRLAERNIFCRIEQESDRNREFGQYWDPEEDKIANAILTDAGWRWRYVHTSGLI